MNYKARIIDEAAQKRILARISHEILEKNEDPEKLCLIGIKTRGIPLAKRIAENIKMFEGKEIRTGELDITLYRDDLTYANEDGKAGVGESRINFDITGLTVILVDDVIFTGRTARAALDAIMKLGRPSKIQLAVLCDRGHRELPIRPDYVGKNIPTSRNEIVKVKIKETDNTDCVEIYGK